MEPHALGPRSTGTVRTTHRPRLNISELAGLLSSGNRTLRLRFRVAPVIGSGVLRISASMLQHNQCVDNCARSTLRPAPSRVSTGSHVYAGLERAGPSGGRRLPEPGNGSLILPLPVI